MLAHTQGKRDPGLQPSPRNHGKGAIEMKERPILFSGEMVRAILEGRKTQTRRIVKLPKQKGLRFRWKGALVDGGEKSPFKSGQYLHIPFRCIADGKKGWNEGMTHREFCPHGIPGDHLWVRENHKFNGTLAGPRCTYRADNTEKWFEDAPDNSKAWLADDDNWRPSIFLPRWASRITLEIVKVRVERLQDISERDAIEEGIERDAMCGPCSWHQMLWEKINGKGSWAKNPWVWVIEFKRI